MITINRSALREGLLVTGRNNKSSYGKAIRAGVHSFTNHNAMVVKATQAAIDLLLKAGLIKPGYLKPGDWCIAEAEPPASTLTSIEDYEKMMNNDGYLVRFYRLKSFSKDQHRRAAKYFVDHLLNLPYPRKSQLVILAMPIYNAIIDKWDKVPSIRMNWCSQLVKRAYLYICANCLDGICGKKKVLFSPKTFENRIMFGLFSDLTDTILCGQ